MLSPSPRNRIKRNIPSKHYFFRRPRWKVAKCETTENEDFKLALSNPQIPCFFTRMQFIISTEVSGRSLYYSLRSIVEYRCSRRGAYRPNKRKKSTRIGGKPSHRSTNDALPPFPRSGPAHAATVSC